MISVSKASLPNDEFLVYTRNDKIREFLSCAWNNRECCFQSSCYSSHHFASFRIPIHKRVIRGSTVVRNDRKTTSTLFRRENASSSSSRPVGNISKEIEIGYAAVGFGVITINPYAGSLPTTEFKGIRLSRFDIAFTVGTVIKPMFISRIIDNSP